MAANLNISGRGEFTEKVLQSDVPVLVDFWAAWCGPCKMIGPAIEQLATEYDGKARVVKIDVDRDGDIAAEYGVMNIPAVFVFKGGKIVDKHIGAAPKAVFAGLIDRNL